MISDSCWIAGCERAVLASKVPSFDSFPFSPSPLAVLHHAIGSTARPRHSANEAANNASQSLSVAGLLGMMFTCRARRRTGHHARGFTTCRHSFRPVLDLLGSRESELEEQVKSLEGDLENLRHDAQALKKERDEAKADMHNLKITCMELAAKQLELNNASTSVQKRSENLDVVLAEHRIMLEEKEGYAIMLQEQLDQANAQAKAETKSLEETVEILKAAKDNLEEIQVVKDEAAEAQLAEAREESEKVRVSMQEISEKFRATLEGLEEMQALAQQFETQLGKLEAEKTSLEEAQAEMQLEMEELQTENSSLRESTEELQTENNSLSESNANLGKRLLQDEVDGQKFSFQAEVETDALRTEIKSLKNKCAEMDALKTENESLKNTCVEMDALKIENESLKNDADSLQEAKEKLEKLREESECALEVKVSQLKTVMQAKVEDKEQTIAKMDTEIQQLKLGNDSLVQAVHSFKSSREDIEQVKASVNQAAEARIAEAQIAVLEANANRTEVAARLQAEIDALKTENKRLELSATSSRASKEEFTAKLEVELEKVKSRNMTLEKQILSWKQSMDRFQAESTGLVSKLEAVLPQELTIVETGLEDLSGGSLQFSS